MYTESELRMIGMKCLSDRLGPVDAERFIVSMNRNAGDYTLSRREIFDSMTADEVREGARKYMESNPLPPKAKARIDAFKTAGN